MQAEGVSESGVPIATAAAALGLTPEAVRKRVKRGTLEAYKKGGQWRVILPENRPVSGSAASPESDPVQAIALTERLIAPWAAQVADLQGRVILQAEEMGRLRAELAAAEAKLAERSTIAQPAAPVEPTSTTPRHWWQVWRA